MAPLTKIRDAECPIPPRKVALAPDLAIQRRVVILGILIAEVTVAVITAAL